MTVEEAMNPLPYTLPVIALALAGIALPSGGTRTGKIRRFVAAVCLVFEVLLTGYALTI